MPACQVGKRPNELRLAFKSSCSTFKANVKVAEYARKIGVIERGMGKKRDIPALPRKFSDSPLQQDRVQIEHPESPSSDVRALASVSFVWVEDYDLANGSSVNCSPVVETLCSILNYADGCPFMSMSCKGISKVLCVKKFYISNVIRAPNSGELTAIERIVVAVHASVHPHSHLRVLQASSCLDPPELVAGCDVLGLRWLRYGVRCTTILIPNGRIELCDRGVGRNSLRIGCR